ncbi:MAG: aminoacyl-histidine dipeptidase [Thermoplasmatota archaeon]
MKDLEPKKVWNFFKEISEIPRCSGNEEKIAEYIASIAERNDCDYKIDEVGNVLIKKPGNVEGKTTKAVLQGHMDMVCEKDEGVEHDFAKDSISLKKEGEWLTAEGTTLGADNGIGLAIALAILEDDSINHGPLEFLFTVSEETGLDGAQNITPGYLEGRKLINLDSEEFGAFTIGCAGGGESEVYLSVKRSGKEKDKLLEISIDGLLGGHSGLDIDKGRANSIKVLGRILWSLNKRLDEGIGLLDIEGGNKRNAIPRFSKAVINVPGEINKVKEIMNEVFSDIREEYSSVEEEMEMNVKEIQSYGEDIMENSKEIFDLRRALPHGVLFMSQEVPGLVRTSTNLATIKIVDEKLEIPLKTRSSLKSELRSTRDRIRAIGENFDAEIIEDESYPGWDPDMSSEILQISKDVYKELFGEEPKVEALHAGLETGLIGETIEGMDMISMGATIENPHSTKERLHIGSVAKFYKMVTKILERLAEK